MMANQSIPKLRFPKYSDIWKPFSLKEVTSINPKTNYLPESFIYVDLESVTEGALIKEEIIFKDEAPSRAQRLLKEGDIIYQTVRPYQRNNYYFNKKADNYVASTGYAQLRTKSNSRFLYQYLHTDKFVNKVLVRCTGTSYPAINSNVLSKIVVHLPCLDEQQKIAYFLTAVDDKITQLTKKKALLEQYKKGAMQQLFNQEIRFKDDDGNEYPDWEEKELGKMGTFQTSSVDKLSNEYEKNVYLINYMDVYGHKDIDNNTIKSFQIVTAKESQIKSCNLKMGDILFTPSSETTSDIGHSVVIFEDIANAVYSYHLIRFRPKIKLNILFSHYFCNTSNVLRQLSRFATGSTRFTISIANFSKVLVKYPCLEEQAKIANFLSGLDNKITNVDSQIEKTVAFKKGLLQQMFV